MKICVRNLAIAAIILVMFCFSAVRTDKVQAAEDYPLQGNWTATVTGQGSFDIMTQQANGGSLTIQVQITGDINGIFQYIADYTSVSSGWQGTSAAIDGSIKVDGVDHPGTLWLKGDITNFSFTGFPPTGWNVELSCPIGGTHGYTTDGSDIVADFEWTGACSGGVDVAIQDMTWSVSGGGSGSYTGVANECISGKTQFAGAGTGTVSLAASPIVASIDYDIAEDGTFILANYLKNPAGEFNREGIEKYIQVDTNLKESDINWDNTEFRIYYYEEDLAGKNIDESSLAIFFWDEDRWTRVTDSGVNTEENYVWGKLEHFSVYSALVADTLEEEDNQSESTTTVSEPETGSVGTSDEAEMDTKVEVTETEITETVSQPDTNTAVSKSADSEEKSGGISGLLIGGIAVAVILIAGGIFWFVKRGR